MALTGSEQRGMDHERLLVELGRLVRLDDFDPGYTGDFKGKRDAKWAPWHVIPADHKWFMRTAIADVIVRRLKALHLQYPAPAAQKSMLEEIRKELA